MRFPFFSSSTAETDSGVTKTVILRVHYVEVQLITIWCIKKKSQIGIGENKYLTQGLNKDDELGRCTPVSWVKLRFFL